MKKSLIILVTFIVLAGCGSSSESGNAIGGVLKSEDGGKTFEAKNYINESKSLANSNVTSLKVDSLNGYIYAGTATNDLYVSHDGAKSWQLIQTALINITQIIVNPFDAKILYVSGMYEGRGSVIRSGDGGETWERVYVEPKDGTNITTMAITPLSGNVLYIGTSGGTIARTFNEGNSWENLYHAESEVVDLLVDAGDENTLYALVDGKDIIKSRDSGVTFESISRMERDKKDEELLYEGTLYSMAVSSSEPGVIVVGTNKGVFRSQDYGLSWQSIDVIASTIDIPIHAIKISPHDSNKIVYAAAKAVYTGNTGSWEITDTTSNRVVKVIELDPINSQNVYLGLQKSK